MLLDSNIGGIYPYTLDRSGLTALDYGRLRRDSNQLLEPFNVLVFEMQNAIGGTFVDALEVQ